MSFLKNIFGSKEETINNYDDFWNWFQKNEKTFYKAVSQNNAIEKNFFEKLSPRLNELREGYYFLTGMMNDNTAELVLTADGIVKNIVFVEELVNAAPVIDGWKFTALKPALNIEDVTIRMADYEFTKSNISFYYNEDPNYPDEIDVVIINNDLNEANKDTIINGTFIFLDNLLGELNFATTIDNIVVLGKENAQKELIPIEKLKDFLIWREKEFIEKYDGLWHSTETDNHSILEGTLQNGKPLLAVINMDLLSWENKASHPWILDIIVKFVPDKNGFPNDKTMAQLNDFEDILLGELKDSEGYLNIGRETADGTRDFYFACKDFRKVSKVVEKIIADYEDKFNISFDIYKDKYWQSFNRFIN
ncbi:DUF695 domain-containing protein [Pedobacter polaris]|uniref:DUF695 domain-containing protein n=1 Tax=Pedobacter polaris TaxID=2571273 RepID=A0A4U1CRC0_9SPHI|nr:DUF695 domain-containing protein [Pedobacter polaris]TKC08302.1 DUF695 domain-containing protein [Pedobacter polaris]